MVHDAVQSLCTKHWYQTLDCGVISLVWRKTQNHSKKILRGISYYLKLHMTATQCVICNNAVIFSCLPFHFALITNNPMWNRNHPFPYYHRGLGISSHASCNTIALDYILLFRLSWIALFAMAFGSSFTEPNWVGLLDNITWSLPMPSSNPFRTRNCERETKFLISYSTFLCVYGINSFITWHLSGAPRRNCSRSN